MSALAALMLWAVACSHLDAKQPVLLRYTVLLLPVLMVIAYGMLALVLLVYGVLTFKSMPEEAASLRAEVQEAHAWLRAKGVHIS